MKHTSKLLCLLLAALFVIAGCSQPADQPDTGAPSDDSVSDSAETPDTTEAPADTFDPASDPRFGTAVNVDCDAIWHMYRGTGKKLDNLEETCINWFNSRFKDVGISDILYNMDTIVPTECREEKYERLHKTVENGVKVDYSNDEATQLYYKIYAEGDIDPFAIWFEQCRENGINPWISFRMNDVHYANEPTGHNDFFYKAKANGWMIGNSRESYWFTNRNTQGSRFWYQYAYNYAIPEVREYVLTYIDEMLGKYDAYGIELDWQRTIWCFPEDSKDNCKYMDLLMEELNKIVEKYEKQYGHEIKIMARIGRDIDQNEYFGFDVRGWAEKDWIDVVVPASYWGSTDSAMPIAAWKEALKDYDVEVYAGMESHTVNNNFYHTRVSLAGYTAMYLQQGADKIYLYNLFGIENGCYKICSSLDVALKNAKRVYLMTWQNTTPCVEGIEAYDPLPMKVKGGEAVEPLVFEHGRVNAKKDFYIYVGIASLPLEKIEAANLTVKYNGYECEYKGTTPKSFVTDSTAFGTILSFRIPDEAYAASTTAEITFAADSTLTVTYVELMNGPPSLG